MMPDLNVVCYVFKENYKKKLLEQFNTVTDRLYYVDILKYNQEYKQFIRKLTYLIVTYTNYKKEDYLYLNDLLTSDKVIDRLNGLKKCKDLIKITT